MSIETVLSSSFLISGNQNFQLPEIKIHNFRKQKHKNTKIYNFVKKIHIPLKKFSYGPTLV